MSYVPLLRGVREGFGPILDPDFESRSQPRIKPGSTLETVKMAKGKKTGGRKTGTPNKATDSIRVMLCQLLHTERSAREWDRWLKHRDPHYRWEAFKLAQSYMFGKPLQPVATEEPKPPIKIDVSAIPQYRVPA